MSTSTKIPNDLLPLDEKAWEAASLPGQCPTKTTLVRWANIGLKGVKLQSLCVGARIYTRTEWLIDFVDKVTREKARKYRSKAKQ